MFPREGVAVRHSTSAIRPARRRTAIVGVLATFASAWLACGVAAADTVATDFEAPAFQPASVNGQPVNAPPRWKSAVPGNIPSLPLGYDQAVVPNSGAPGAFGGQSLRMSNAYNPAPGTFPPEYHYQTYSKPTTATAGENLTNTVYTAQFSFISIHPDRQQSGLHMDVSPDNGEGGRMSYIGLTDTQAGINVLFYDTDKNGKFVPHDLGTLPRDVPHTIRFFMRLVPGPNNDLLRIVIDGRDAGQCFTTWESVNQPVPAPIDRLLFRSNGTNGNIPSLVGGGFLFDNVTTTTAPGTGPADCDTPIDKQADTATVEAGGLAGYQITLRNRGTTVARNLQVCDRIARRTTFVRADRKLARLGRARCLLIPRLAPGQRVSFHIDVRVDATAPPGPLANIADVTPLPPPGSLRQRLLEVDLPRPLAPGAQAPVRTASVPVRRARAVVRVLRRVRPNFTG
jgi:uncharacterized repeat protein (TIGR01451 family)